MKQTLIFFFLSLGFALVAADLSQEQALKIYHITEKIDFLTRDYEIAAISGDKAKLNVVLTTSKSLTSNISSLQYDLKQEVDSDDWYHEHAFLNQIQRGFELLQLNAKARQLRTVQLEILGLTSGVSKVPNYQNSEKLALKRSLIGEHFISSYLKLEEVDKLFEGARKKNPGHLTVDDATKDKVSKLLKEFSSSMSSVKVDIEKEYYDVVESMRLRGEELSVATRFNIEFGIDAVNFSINFVKELLDT